MRAMSFKLPIASIACLAVMTAGCGGLSGQDRSSAIVIIDALQAASGAVDPPVFTGTLNSDVLTEGGVINDSGRVTMRGRQVDKDMYLASCKGTDFEVFKTIKAVQSGTACKA